MGGCQTPCSTSGPTDDQRHQIPFSSPTTMGTHDHHDHPRSHQLISHLEDFSIVNPIIVCLITARGYSKSSICESVWLESCFVMTMSFAQYHVSALGGSQHTYYS